jgi:hypothetical protein
VEDLVDALEQVIGCAAKLGMLEDVYKVPAREAAVTRLFEGVEVVLGAREMTPEHLKVAFLAACEAAGTGASLNLAGFKKLEAGLRAAAQTGSLVTTTSSASFSFALASPTKAASFEEHDDDDDDDEDEARDFEIEEAFRDADTNGNNTVDIYEFIAMHEKVAKGRRAARSQLGSSVTAGHRLSLRTIECCERVMSVTKAGGGRALDERRFSRYDRSAHSETALFVFAVFAACCCCKLV